MHQGALVRGRAGAFGRSCSSSAAASSSSKPTNHPLATHTAQHGFVHQHSRGRGSIQARGFGRSGAAADGYDEVIVESGDTFLGIAIESGCTYDDLLKLNKMTPRQVDLMTGQRLRVPKGKGSKMPGRKEIVHVVNEGESLWDIAQDYGTTTEEVLQANNIRKSESWMVQEGQRVVIPVPAGLTIRRRGQGARGVGGKKQAAAKKAAATTASTQQPGLAARVRAMTESDAFTLWLPLVGAALVVSSLLRLQQQNRALELQRQEIWRMRITPDAQWPPGDEPPPPPADKQKKK